MPLDIYSFEPFPPNRWMVYSLLTTHQTRPRGWRDRHLVWIFQRRSLPEPALGMLQASAKLPWKCGKIWENDDLTMKNMGKSWEIVICCFDIALLKNRDHNSNNEKDTEIPWNSVMEFHGISVSFSLFELWSRNTVWHTVITEIWSHGNDWNLGNHRNVGQVRPSVVDI